MKHLSIKALGLFIVTSIFSSVIVAEPYPTSKDRLPCIKEACIGDDADTLTEPLKPILSLREQLLFNANHQAGSVTKTERRTVTRLGDEISEADFNKQIDIALSAYTKGNIDLFKETIKKLTKLVRKPRNLRENATLLENAWAYSTSLLPDQPPKLQSDVAAYFIPQPQREIKRTYADKNAFDLKLIELLKNQTPKFCEPRGFTGQFESDSGYPTFISIKTDTDGKFKISTIRRIYNPSNEHEAQDLTKRLAEKYQEFSTVTGGLSLIMLGGEDLGYGGKITAESNSARTLTLRHPMYAYRFSGSTETYNLDRWTKGWLQIKNSTYDNELSKIFAKLPGCTKSIPID